MRERHRYCCALNSILLYSIPECVSDSAGTFRSCLRILPLPHKVGCRYLERRDKGLGERSLLAQTHPPQPHPSPSSHTSSPPNHHASPSTTNRTKFEHGTLIIPFAPPSSLSPSIFLTPAASSSSTDPSLHHLIPKPRKQISYLSPRFTNPDFGRNSVSTVLLWPTARVTKPFSGDTNGCCFWLADDEGSVALLRPSPGTAGPWPSL